jgi:sugar phosphate isomerase/epimerase
MVELLAAYTTVAGDVRLGAEDESSPVPFAERVEAIASAGYVGLGLTHDELLRVSTALGWSGVRRRIEAAGLARVDLEMLFDWFLDGEERSNSDMRRANLLVAAAELGACQLKVGGTMHDGHWSLDKMAHEFGALCEAFAAVGTDVVIEPMPFGNLTSLRAAAELVEASGAPNGGIIADVWHVARMGDTFDDAVALPEGVLRGVELNDGPRQPVVDDIIAECLDHRVLPGQGQLNVGAFVGAVKKTGFSGHWGVEIMSIEHRQLSVRDQAIKSFDAATAVIG